MVNDDSAGDRRYPKYVKEVNVILDLARAARRLEHTFDKAPANDILQCLDELAGNWAISLIEIILDYEDSGRLAQATPAVRSATGQSKPL